MSNPMNAIGSTHVVLEQFGTQVEGFCNAHSSQAMQALEQLSCLSWMDPSICVGGAPHFHHAPACGAIPYPSIEQSGAPAGKGLSKDPTGWPKGSIKTAGGYTVVPEKGNNAWSIYAPGQKSGDKAHTRIWGDPHVDEKDGTRWDFTKNSNFRLPDGTLISARTTSQKGQSVTKGLTITNGADRVDVTGIDKNQPKVGPIKNDGYEWRSQHVGNSPNRDTFVLGGTKDNVQWFKEKGGQVEGLITGSKQDRQGSYQQVLNRGKNYFVDPRLRPPLGSRAWGNQFRSAVTDSIAQMGLPSPVRDMLTSFVSLDHAQTAFMDSLSQMWPNGCFGGLSHSPGGLEGAFGAIGRLGDELLTFAQMDAALKMSLHTGLHA